MINTAKSLRNNLVRKWINITPMMVADINQEAEKVLPKKILLTMANRFSEKLPEKYSSFRLIRVMGRRIRNQHKYNCKFLKMNFFRMPACALSGAVFNFEKTK